jgi:tetratricopeptide (TPR) repeat protein
MGELIEMNGAPEQEAPQADGIRAFDQNGQEVIVPREEWRTNVLPGMLKEIWDQPEQSYMLILNSLNDGFVAEVADAAEHLAQTDPVPARGTCIWGIVLIQQGRLDEAQTLLEGFGKTHGEDGSVLTNLAKVYAAKGNAELAASTLWRALEVEPNLDNGLGWYLAQAQEAGGEAAVLPALQKVAALPGSWRALLWMARQRIQSGDLAGAMEMYGDALARVQTLGLPGVPGDFLMQMSGDLGGGGHLAELVELTGPYFVPELHGMPVGNNLIKANFDLGNLQAARAIVDALATFQRPEWRQPLGFWAQEIARVGGGNASEGSGMQPVDPGVQIGMLRIDGPIWLPAGSPGAQLFGAIPSAKSDLAVTFMGGTAEAPKVQPTPQMIDAIGRLTRSLPMFLSEQVSLRTAVQGRAMLPWATGEQSGFVIAGEPWSAEQAVAAVAQPNGDTAPSTYAVTVHLDATVEPWTAELVFLRMSDGTQIGEMFAEFPADAPEDGLPGLANEVVEMMESVDPASSSTTAGRYVVPGGAAFGGYLLRLEQLLAVRCASMDANGTKVPASFLSGEREILEGELQMCMDMPESVPARLLLIETMTAMLRVKPELVEEFRGRVDKLMTEKPLSV